MELTDKEKKMCSLIAMDLESGNYLLRPREEEYRKFMNEFFIAKQAFPQDRTERMNEIIKEVDSCF